MLPFYRILSHERSTFMTQNHQHFQRNQQQRTYQPHESHRPPNGSSVDQRGNFSGGNACDWNYRCKRSLRAVRASPGSGSICRRGKQCWETNSPGWPARCSLLAWWESASFPLKGCISTNGSVSLRKNTVSSKISCAVMAMLPGFTRRSRCLISSYLCSERA